jgi:hypothetical protein
MGKLLLSEISREEEEESWGSIVRLKLAKKSCVRSGFESRSSASGAFAASPNSDSATFVGGNPRYSQVGNLPIGRDPDSRLEADPPEPPSTFVAGDGRQA